MTPAQIAASAARLVGTHRTVEVRLKADPITRVATTYTGSIEKFDADRQMITVIVNDGYRPSKYTPFLADITAIAVVPIFNGEKPFELVLNQADSFGDLFNRRRHAHKAAA